MKKIIFLALVSLGIASVLGLSMVSSNASAQVSSGINAATTDEMKNKQIDGSNGVIRTISNILIWVVGIVAVIMIVWSGFKYITTAGDASKVASAKSSLTYAIVGLTIAILSYSIVNFIMERLDVSSAGKSSGGGSSLAGGGSGGSGGGSGGSGGGSGGSGGGSGGSGGGSGGSGGSGGRAGKSLSGGSGGGSGGAGAGVLGAAGGALRTPGGGSRITVHSPSPGIIGTALQRRLELEKAREKERLKKEEERRLKDEEKKRAAAAAAAAAGGAGAGAAGGATAGGSGSGALRPGL